MNSLDADEVLFVPDKYLGSWVQRHTDKRLILWPGYCPTHNRIVPEHILALKAEHPHAEVMAHPECTPDVADVADHVVSTGGMARVAKESAAKEFIVATEEGMLHRLRKENPDKIFYHVGTMATCPNMKKTTLEKVLASLQEMKYAITVSADVAEKARLAIQRMLDAS